MPHCACASLCLGSIGGGGGTQCQGRRIPGGGGLLWLNEAGWPIVEPPAASAASKSILLSSSSRLSGGHGGSEFLGATCGDIVAEKVVALESCTIGIASRSISSNVFAPARPKHSLCIALCKL